MSRVLCHHAAMTDQPLYQQLAERIAVQVRGGSLRAGARLPSVRAFAAQHAVSISTAVQAYRALEDRGLIEPRPKSGYFVLPQRVRAPEPAPTRPPARAVAVEPHALIDALMCATRDPDLVSFGAACPDGGHFPVDRLRRALARSAQRHRAALVRYSMAPGSEPIRQAIAQRAMHMGCALDHQRVVVTGGCLEAIGLCLRTVTRPGDVVAIESPTYFGFLQLLQTLGLRAFEVPMQPRTGLSLEALELALDTQPIKAVLAVPTLANPLGTTMPLEAKRRLAQMLARRGVPLIEDVLQNELAQSEDARRAVKSFDDTGNVMLCGSFGKTLAPGLRLGWVEAGRWSAEVARLKSVLSGGCTEFLELTVAELLTQGGYEQTLRHLRSLFARQVAHARRVVSASFPAGTRVTDPGGGFILWVEMPRAVDATELYRRCFERGIVIGPGPLFTASTRYRNCIRLGVGGRWSDAHDDGLREIGRIATELAAGPENATRASGARVRGDAVTA